MTVIATIRIPDLLCIQTHVFFVNPIYSIYPPLGIPEGIKKYMSKPVLAMIKNRAAKIMSIK
jgi:hypothetical protein